ncbi:Pvc16 family protein [Glutamicibacter uratoxydans]|uniref:Pvc16 family protein n=1 Tax=Glutamicibacter uratoxydans TaxID=43667 RepID=UPI003D6E4EFE
MSEFSIIHDVTLQLRREIFQALNSTADTDFGLDGQLERITLDSPAAESDDATVASMYLYRFGINPALRNQAALPNRSDPSLLHHPPLPVQLHYLFTPLLTEESVNLLVLGRV